MQTESQTSKPPSHSTAGAPESRMASQPAFPLSPLDHIMPRRYTFRLLFFPTGNRDPLIITTTLKAGLTKTLETLPLLSGTVKPYLCPTNSGRLCITAPWSSVDDIFHVAHRLDLSYDEIRNSGFSMLFLEFEDILPMFSNTDIDPFSIETPVLMVQINFIKSGMIMGFCLHHSFVDGTGAPEVLKIWAAFCRGDEGWTEKEVRKMTTRERVMNSEAGKADLGKFYEYFDKPLPEDLEEKIEETRASTAGALETKATIWLDRTIRRCSSYLPQTLFFPITATARLIGELIEAYGPSQLASLSTYLSNHTISPTSIPSPQMSTDIFFFPAPALSTLKALLSTSLPPATYISTNDALSALCFACITHARHPTPTTPLDLAITLDGRRLLSPPLPANWLGNLALHAQISAPLSSVTPPTIPALSALALRLRERILALDTAYVDNLVASLSNVEDVSRITPSFIWGRKTGEGMLVASWAGQGWYGVQWGAEVGCACERMRLPKVRFARYNGFCVVFPRVGGVGEGKGKGVCEGVGMEGVGEVDGEGGKGAENVEEEGLEVMVGLERGAMGRLMEMEMWTRFGRWRCE